MAGQILSYVANGNIKPCRAVRLDTSAEGKVITGSATNQKIIGVSQEGSRRAPGSDSDDGYCAKAGENVKVYGPGSRCLLALGGTVTIDDRLECDSDGAGVTTTTDNEAIFARALQSGVSGQQIMVEVIVAARY